MELVLEVGADDFKEQEDGFEIYCAPGDFYTVSQALEEKGVKTQDSKIMSVAKTTVAVTGDAVSKVLKLVDALEDHDDVQDVYHNAEISDEDMEKAMEAE